MQFDNLKVRIKSRAIKYRLELKRYIYRNLISNDRKAYVSIIYDYEGDYCRKGLGRISEKGVSKILDIHTKYNIPGTFNVVGKLIKDIPEIISRISSDNHEIASHSYNHNIIPTLSKSEMVRDFEKCREIFESIGVKLRGFRSPQSKWNFRQMSILLNQGLDWNAEGDSASYPYVIMKKREKCLLRLPVIMDDWAYESKNIKPREMLERMNECVNNICNEKRYGAIGFHPWVQGKDDNRMTVFDEFIHALSEKKDINILTCGSMHKMVFKNNIA